MPSELQTRGQVESVTLDTFADVEVVDGPSERLERITQSSPRATASPGSGGITPANGAICMPEMGRPKPPSTAKARV